MNRVRAKHARAALSGAILVLVAGTASAQHAGHQMQGMSSEPGPASQSAPVAPAAAPTQPAQGAGASGSRANPNTPRPPENTSGPMSMPVSDNMTFYQLLLDELEYRRTRRGGSGLAWDFQGWVGKDYSRLWIKSEGERQGSRTEDARLELLYSKPVAAFWDIQAGVRHDFGQGPVRDWAAVGVQGIAPYWFDVEATVYAASQGRTALRLKGEYSFVLTQRTFLTPKLEANFYGKDDPARGIGSGLSDMSFGLRLRHEFNRQFAPYVGVNWDKRFGASADLARAAGEQVTRRQLVIGVRAWF